MRLKKLDIAGFKSFPERTQVHLVEGVTAIIGPNGCGKTNILDALRWVMGEQRPTLLRGGKMEDVIFNGSQAMKAHGMAEVSLSIENTRGVLPTEYDEVQLTRRLFRSGESEYYLNRTQCRLRDITDLFADTGMGANAYSVIQQHMIDALISDKAEERRVLFEEAAGITKYKQRKRAALRKLEATEQDLQRLQDIVAEVKTQVNSLNRQMKKAERYQKTHIELKSLELAVAKVTLDALDSERREKNLLLTEQQDVIQGAETTLAAVGAELEQERTRQDEFDARLAEASRKVQAKTEEGHTLDKRISGARERIESLSAQRERNITEIQACDRRAESLQADESSLKAQLVAAEEKLQQALAEVAAAEQRSETADARALDAKGAAESHTEKLMALEGRISSGRSDTHNLSQQEEELTARVNELGAALEQLAEVSGADAAEREQLSATVSECEQRLADTTAEAVAVNEQIESLTAQLDDRTERITDLSAALESTQTRMRLLEETIAQHEGFGAGVSAALDNTERWPALLGAVADLITPQEGRTLAIEAALDDIAGYLVTRDRRTAREIISYLGSERKGKAAIFALEGFVTGGAAEPRRPVPESGFIGWADTLVSPHAEVAGLARALLRNTAVFDETLDELSDAELTALLSRLPAETQVVSTAGTLYRGAGALAGGSEEGLPRFGRQERVRELQEKITALQSDLESARRAKNDDVAQIARLRARLSEVDERIAGAREDKSDAEKRLTEVDAALRGHANERTRLEKEKTAATGKLDLLKHRQYTLSLDVDQLATEKERLMSIAGERATALSELEAEAQRAAEALNRLQVRLVEEKSAIQQVTDKILHLQELRNEITQTRDNKLAENERALADIETAKRDISELESQLQVVLNERGELSRAEAELRRERDELMTVLREHERKGRDARGVKDSAVSQAHKLDLRISQIDSESAALLERIEEEYSIDPRAFVQPADSELPPLESSEQLNAARQTVHDLKQRLKSYGAVNLLALEEHGSATERYEKLSTQVEDLINAKNTLQSTINKINKTARELFAETFDKARENFQSIFTELFDGGECDIRLRDESDPLESDIEIHARPKGKKLVTITQMSGGERALTAISLLFSLYLVKPSPFCILDEIDAPLDDANCHRFLRLIRRFSNQTQFIVITHNKITMEAADTLYGVTMESAGISKLVSVHFAEDGEGGTRLVPIAEIESANGSGSGNGAARQDGGARTAPQPASEPEIPPVVAERMRTTVTTVEPTEAAIRLGADRAESDETDESDD